MSKPTHISTNIRWLRRLYGETQEELAQAIYVQKNTVSQYESGNREPDREKLQAIADHYLIPVERLIFSDMSWISEMQQNKLGFQDYIGVMLPAVSSQKAMQNINFRRAHASQSDLYNWFRKDTKGVIDVMDICAACIEDYQEAAEDDDIKAEAAANIIAVVYLLLLEIKLTALFIKERPATFDLHEIKDVETRLMFENRDPELMAELEDINQDPLIYELYEMIPENLLVMKKSKDYAELADYYLAIQYFCGLVDNSIEFAYNQRIGIEMLLSFASVKNPYAIRFLDYNLKALTNKGSQHVNND